MTPPRPLEGRYRRLLAPLIRLRPPRDDTRRGWADALAVASVPVPVLVLAYLTALNLVAQAALPGGITGVAAALESLGVGTAAWAILAVLVLLRLPRVAGVAAGRRPGIPAASDVNGRPRLSLWRDAGKRTGYPKPTNARHYRPRLAWKQSRR